MDSGKQWQELLQNSGLSGEEQTNRARSARDAALEHHHDQMHRTMDAQVSGMGDDEFQANYDKIKFHDTEYRKISGKDLIGSYSTRKDGEHNAYQCNHCGDRSPWL